MRFVSCAVLVAVSWIPASAATKFSIPLEQRTLPNSLTVIMQSRALLAQRLGSLWIYGLDAQFIRKNADDIVRTTTAQVQQASAHYLAPDKMTVVAVGEDKVVREQFAPFNLPVVDAPKP